MKKENSITLQPEMATSVKVSNPFSWTTVQKFYNAMPGEVTPCENIYDAKMYTCAACLILAGFIPFLLLPGAWLFISAKKGGRS